MTKQTTNAKFSWNEENTAQAVTMYQKMIEENGVEFANTDGLTQIAVELGAASGVAVRGKLSSAKAYQKTDKPRKVGGGSSLRKAHYVRAFATAAKAKGLVTSDDELASLEQSKISTLEIMAKLLGMDEEIKKSVEQ